MKDAAAAGRSRMAWLFLAALAVMVALAVRTPLDHDEGQYVAAADLVAKGLLPYRDFPYLQTPLQPFLFAPLAWIAPGWVLIASRLANGLCVALAIFLTECSRCCSHSSAIRCCWPEVSAATTRCRSCFSAWRSSAYLPCKIA